MAPEATTRTPTPAAPPERPPVLKPILITIAAIKAFAALRGDGGALVQTAQATPVEDDSGNARALPVGLLDAGTDESHATDLAGVAPSTMHFALAQDSSGEGDGYFGENDVPTGDQLAHSASGSGGGIAGSAGGSDVDSVAYSLDAGGVSANPAGGGSTGGGAGTSAGESAASDRVDDIPDDGEQNDTPPGLIDEGSAGGHTDDGANAADLAKAIGDIELTGGVDDDRLDGGDGDDQLAGGDGDDTLHGGAGDDRLSGGSGDDTLDGGSDDDILTGDAGDDRLSGGTGDDVLVGGLGNDILEGGDGADRFVFDETSDSASETADRVFDFNAFDGDKIDVSAIDANSWTLEDDAFAFIGDNAFSGTAGELRFTDSSYYGVLEGDLNGDGAADFGLGLLGVGALTAEDVIL